MPVFRVEKNSNYTTMCNGVDYAITKGQNVMPPKYTVFFKAKDADALTSAFEELTC